MFGDTPTDQQKSDDQTNTAPDLSLGMNPDAGTGAISDPSASDSLSSSSSANDNASDNASVPIVEPGDSGSEDKSSSSDGKPADDDLDNIKKQALSQLSPLVHKLDQSPEEKYRTLIMMVQASDNKDLIGEAYEAAQKITDEKAKAEALLTIVNEINYFSQK
jgi:hypothetical protein